QSSSPPHAIVSVAAVAAPDVVPGFSWTSQVVPSHVTLQPLPILFEAVVHAIEVAAALLNTVIFEAETARSVTDWSATMKTSHQQPAFAVVGSRSSSWPTSR